MAKLFDKSDEKSIEILKKLLEATLNLTPEDVDKDVEIVESSDDSAVIEYKGTKYLIYTDSKSNVIRRGVLYNVDEAMITDEYEKLIKPLNSKFKDSFLLKFIDNVDQDSLEEEFIDELVDALNGEGVLENIDDDEYVLVDMSDIKPNGINTLQYYYENK